MSEDPGKNAADRYAKALKDALEPLLSKISQRKLATMVSWDHTTISRFRNGIMIAPKKFIEQAAVVSTRYGHPWSDDVVENLHTLRKEAEKAASPEVQNRYLKEQNRHLHEEILRVKADITEKEEIAWRSGRASMVEMFKEWKNYADGQVKDLEGQLKEVTEELAQERQRVQTLEVELRDVKKRQGEDNDLVRELKAKLARQQDELDSQEIELRQSREEIKVLRTKVENLSDGKPVSEVAPQVKKVGESARGAARDPKTKGNPTQRDRSRSAQDDKSGTDSSPAQTSSTKSAPASPDPTSSAAPQRSFMGSLFAAVSVLSSLCVPIFLYLNFAAFAAACFSKDGPPWWGLVMVALANSFFTVAGLLLLMGISRVTAEMAAPQGKEWSWGYPGTALLVGGLASVVSLISGIKLLVDGDVTERGLQWLHMFGISG